MLFRSGCGKSTLLKLLMRFWDVNKGNIKISEENVKEIPTKTLRNTQSYVTQETELFHDSIANNIAIEKPGAAREEIIKAAQKASIHDMIMSMPNCYDTEVGELGDTLSGGEKQRIGIAAANRIFNFLIIYSRGISIIGVEIDFERGIERSRIACRTGFQSCSNNRLES